MNLRKELPTPVEFAKHMRMRANGTLCETMITNAEIAFLLEEAAKELRKNPDRKC